MLCIPGTENVNGAHFERTVRRKEEDRRREKEERDGQAKSTCLSIETSAHPTLIVILR